MLVWRSYFDFIAGKSSSSILSLFRVSSFLLFLVSQSVRLDAVMKGVCFVLLEKSLWSRFWTTLLGPYPDDPVINLTAISILSITTLFVHRRQNCVMYSTFDRGNNTISLFPSINSKSFINDLIMHNLFSKSVTSPEMSTKPSFFYPTVTLSAKLAWLLPPIKESLLDSFI